MPHKTEAKEVPSGDATAASPRSLGGARFESEVATAGAAHHAACPVGTGPSGAWERSGSSPRREQAAVSMRCRAGPSVAPTGPATSKRCWALPPGRTVHRRVSFGRLVEPFGSGRGLQPRDFGAGVEPATSRRAVWCSAVELTMGVVRRFERQVRNAVRQPDEQGRPRRWSHERRYIDPAPPPRFTGPRRRGHFFPPISC